MGAIQGMKPLATTFKKNTFTYELVQRDGDIAIYKQRLRPGEGCLAYEVIRVLKAETYEIMGNTVEAHEYAPGNESFGKDGWTYPTLERAKAKMRELLDE